MEWLKSLGSNASGNPRVFGNASSGKISHATLDLKVDDHIIGLGFETIRAVTTQFTGRYHSDTGRYRSSGVVQNIDVNHSFCIQIRLVRTYPNCNHKCRKPRGYSNARDLSSGRSPVKGRRSHAAVNLKRTHRMDRFWHSNHDRRHQRTPSQLWRANFNISTSPHPAG